MLVLRFALAVSSAAFGHLEELRTTRHVLELMESQAYDKEVTPGLLMDPPEPTTVESFVLLNDISDVDVAEMDFNLDMFFRTEWLDQRLNHSGHLLGEYIQTNDPNFLQAIWHPDIYFVNTKEGKSLSLTVPNFLLRIYQNGTVRCSTSCHMDLTHFPMDEQTCSIEVEPFSDMRSDRELILKWKHPNAEDSVRQQPGIQLPSFDIRNISVKQWTMVYEGMGNFSHLTFSLHLARFFGYYKYQVFFPATVTVVVSWLSFWLAPSLTPARVALGVTTFLTLSTQATGIRFHLPAISYTTALDIWLGVCILFVFFAFLEFILVKQLDAMDKSNDSSSPAETRAFGTTEVTPTGVKAVGKKAQNAFSACRSKCPSVDVISRVAFPVAFLIFNIAFWAVYPTPENLFQL